MWRSRDMQSVICAAEPRSYIVAKREARATAIHGEGVSVPSPRVVLGQSTSGIGSGTAGSTCRRGSSRASQAGGHQARGRGSCLIDGAKTGRVTTPAVRTAGEGPGPESLMVRAFAVLNQAETV